MANIPFGERMRRARIQNAMTQTDLGAKLEVTGATISNWEKGKITPSLQQKARITSILGGFAVGSTASSDDASVRPGPSAFGVWMNKTRLEKGLAVAELAESSGVSVPAIYNIESGRIANPRSATVQRLERALGSELPAETRREILAEATIEGVGELIDFRPHEDGDLPSVAGIYVFYDIAERPLYVGQGGDIKKRIRSHRDKFWFRSPIVETGAYVRIDDEGLREKVETLLIRFLKSNAVINKQNVERIG